MSAEQPNAKEVDPKLKRSLEDIRRELDDVGNPDYVSSLSTIDNPEDTILIGTCFNVIKRNVAPAFGRIKKSLEEIAVTKPELQQEINALFANSWVGFLAESTEDVETLIRSGAMGEKGLENGKSKEGFDFIKRIDGIIPTAIDATKKVLEMI